MNNKENKPVINACLNFKHDSYNTSPCVIEKVIELPTSEFEELKDSTLDDNIFIKMHKDLMCFKDNAYHCLMFVDNKNGDGILVESEGADYARYSQYIPNAREILNQANQSEAMKALLKSIDNCIDEFIEQSGDNSDLCFSVNDLLCNPSVNDAIVIMCRESLAKRPEIKGDTILDTNGFVEADKKELTELRLICPLEVDILEYEDSDYDPVTISSRQASAYEDEINEQIATEQMDCEKARGLMYWYDEEKNLSRKVLSVFPSVETIGDTLYGVATVKSYGELTPAELYMLTDYITGQFSDGWGESFEQHPVKIGTDELYVHFWNCDDYYLKPESEVFPKETITPTM